MNNTVYWAWLSMALGAGARTDEIISAYPNPQVLYNQSRTERIISGVFSKAKLDRLEAVKLSKAQNALDLCEKNGWKVYTPEHPDYPEDLKNLIDMPLILYCDGDLEALKNKICIAVVGTRYPTYDSVAIAKKLSADMARCGAVIVSGGALGIDSAAHEGALEVNGITACVLGCGLGTNYLMSREAMRREIVKKGVLISEFPPFTKAGVTTFPIRNRIISGLSKGVLVVEAGEKSGSLITANFALEQGKEVFAVPGSILNSSYSGVNKLIKDGANVVTCAQDILSPFEYTLRGALDLSANTNELPDPTLGRGDKKVNARKPLTANFNEVARKVYEVLSNEPTHSDEIGAITGYSPAQVITALIELELGGFIEQTEGKNYIIS